MKDKSKIVTIILAIVCVISIIGVIYLYTANSSLKSENANLQSELENAQSQLEELQEKITELETTVETLEEVKANLETEQADNTEVTTESTDTDEGTATGEESAADESSKEESGVTVNSTHDDVKLEDDEYKGDNELDGAYESLSDEEKAEVDQILEELLEEHPEWLEDNGGVKPYTGPAQGTPDTGELTDPGYFGHGDYSNIPDGLTVY